MPAQNAIWDSKRVVVVLPLVPETTRLPLGSDRVTSRRACGARRGTRWPAMTVPPPRPRRRLSPAAARPASRAALKRGCITSPRIVADRTFPQRRPLRHLPYGLVLGSLRGKNRLPEPLRPDTRNFQNWIGSCVYRWDHD